MNPLPTHLQTLTRRELLQCLGTGIGSIALTSLLSRDLAAQPAPVQALAPRPPHFAARAKNVIFLHMVGAPSHLELFDYKPVLQRHDGQPVPQELIEGQRFAFLRGHPNLLGYRASGLAGMVGAVWNSPNCCLTSLALPTTSPWSKRYTPKSSIMARLNCSCRRVSVSLAGRVSARG